MALNEATPSLFHSSLAGEPSKTFNSSLFSTSLSLGHSISLCPSIPSSIPQAPLNFGLPNNATSRPHVISVPSTQPSSLVQCLPSWLIQPKSAPFDKLIKPLPVPSTYPLQTNQVSPCSSKLLLLTSLVSQLKAQRSIPDAPTD